MNCICKKTPHVSKGTLKNLMQNWAELEVGDDYWKTHYLLVQYTLAY